MKQQQEAFLARGIIQMIREYKDDVNILQYLDSFAWSIAGMVETEDVANWRDIAGVCDQRHYSIKQGNPIELNIEILEKCEHSLNKYLPKQ